MTEQHLRKNADGTLVKKTPQTEPSRQLLQLAEHAASSANDIREALATKESEVLLEEAATASMPAVLGQLWTLNSSRAAMCAEAGRAFLHVKQPLLASKAFMEASSISRRLEALKTKQLGEDITVSGPYLQSFWCRVSRMVAVAETQQQSRLLKRQYGTTACSCTLMTVATDAPGRVDESAEAGHAALVQSFW